MLEKSLSPSSLPLPPQLLDAMLAEAVIAAQRQQAEKARRAAAQAATWPVDFRNVETGRAYAPHHAAEQEWVTADGPRYGLLKGGEGSGKSTAGVGKDLYRLRRGVRGVLGFPHFSHL